MEYKCSVRYLPFWPRVALAVPSPTTVTLTVPPSTVFSSGFRTSDWKSPCALATKRTPLRAPEHGGKNKQRGFITLVVFTDATRRPNANYSPPLVLFSEISLTRPTSAENTTSQIFKSRQGRMEYIRTVYIQVWHPQDRWRFS